MCLTGNYKPSTLIKYVGLTKISTCYIFELMWMEVCCNPKIAFCFCQHLLFEFSFPKSMLISEEQEYELNLNQDSN